MQEFVTQTERRKKKPAAYDKHFVGLASQVHDMIPGDESPPARRL